ncbi:MAG: PorV/PorQ family protein, partial [bacterium]|nr:PorV/PorQ family protein [bacterium]
MKKLTVVLALGMILGAGAAYCGDAGEKAAAFLKMGAGARASGLTGAYCAIADDSSACYWNPAGLIQLSQKEGSFMYHQPMNKVKGLSYSNINLAVPFGNQAFGASLVYLGYGDMPKYDKEGINQNENYSASDMALSGSYGKKLNKDLSVGGTL